MKYYIRPFGLQSLKYNREFPDDPAHLLPKSPRTAKGIQSGTYSRAMTLKEGPTDGLLCATHELATLVSSEIKSQHLEMFTDIYHVCWI